MYACHCLSYNRIDIIIIIIDIYTSYMYQIMCRLLFVCMMIFLMRLLDWFLLKNVLQLCLVIKKFTYSSRFRILITIHLVIDFFFDSDHTKIRSHQIRHIHSACHYFWCTKIWRSWSIYIQVVLDWVWGIQGVCSGKNVTTSSFRHSKIDEYFLKMDQHLFSYYYY